MKKIFSIVLTLTLLLSMVLPVFATDTSVPSVQRVGGATLVGELADKISVEIDNEYFFTADIMNPGDTWESVIKLENTSGQNMQISLIEIVSKLEDTLLFDALELQIYVGSELIYSGDYSKTDTPVFNWIDFPANSFYELVVITHFPPECGNEYQGKSFDAEWIFEVRADEKLIEEGGNEEIDTGDEVKKNFGYVFLGIAVGAGFFLLITGRKKKEDEDNEKK